MGANAFPEKSGKTGAQDVMGRARNSPIVAGDAPEDESFPRFPLPINKGEALKTRKTFEDLLETSL